MRRLAVVSAWSVGLANAGCEREDSYARTSYFERKIAPVLQAGCTKSGTGSGCHVTADEHGNALGNLDVSAYAMLSKRRDLLVDYGPYGMPQLLVKAIAPYPIRLTAWDGESQDITVQVEHVGAAPIDASSVSFFQLFKWLERGAAENNAETARTTAHASEPCSHRLGQSREFHADVDPKGDDFERFVGDVNPFLSARCAAGNCHGSPMNPLYLTCGETREETRWNYFAASDYTSVDPSSNEILRRALEPAMGGVFHQGGSFFSSLADPNYRAISSWSEQKGPPSNIPAGRGFDLFAHRVEPTFIKKGCLMMGCHSPAGFSDLRLNAGSEGHMSLASTRSNYEEALKFVALESPDPNASRLIRKNLAPASGIGILHRGGPLLAGAGDPARCDEEAALSGPLDEQPPYCVLQAWIATERRERTTDVAPLTGIVYVTRPPSALGDLPQDYESYRPGADLRLRAAHLDAGGALVVDPEDRSLLEGCALSPVTTDVRRPQVAWDGRKLAFAARSSALEGYRVYVMEADGSACGVEPSIAAPAVDAQGAPIPTNGELIHDFDPAFAPDGSLVFASTRGNLGSAAYSYRGPQRTPADPAKLNANLYVLEDGHVRQLTFLLNQEFLPSFKLNGQLLFTTEKRAPDFYQLAGRRLNLDGGDYHPLFGQRRTIGYDQLTDLVQLASLDFAAILSDRGAVRSAGALAVINRSLGTDTDTDDPTAYRLDPSHADFPSPGFFLHSAKILDPWASGRVGVSVRGAYRNPTPLPNADILVSYAPSVSDMTRVSGSFDLVVVNSSTGEQRALTGLDEPSRDELWPVALYGRAPRKAFRSTPADPAGSAVIHPPGDPEHPTDRAELSFLDFPLISSLMFQNTRGGRQIAPMQSFEMWESLPPNGERSLNDASSFIVADAYGKLYARRRRIGSVPLLADGSARVQVPAGLPVLFAVESKFSGESSQRLHHQREEMQYYPGEWVTLSFRRDLFDGFCGGCHGSISGLETDVAVKPDILSQASEVAAKHAQPTLLVGTPASAEQGPPFP
ncbi:MAG TPA: hypothetical protein VFK05_12115 [Polyangiaceae bacterium]|nr:hypothetical protein [Polyangiaceae bacterium]